MSTNVSEIKSIFSSALNLLAKWQWTRCESGVVINSFSSSSAELLSIIRYYQTGEDCVDIWGYFHQMSSRKTN